MKTLSFHINCAIQPSLLIYLRFFLSNLPLRASSLDKPTNLYWVAFALLRSSRNLSVSCTNASISFTFLRIFMPSSFPFSNKIKVQN